MRGFFLLVFGLGLLGCDGLRSAQSAGFLIDEQQNQYGLLSTLAGASYSALDFVIQDVCVNGSNQIIAGDPATCPQHRNVEVGEKIPYLRTDYDTVNNQSYQAVASYPVPGADGALKILHSKIMRPPFNANFSFPTTSHPAEDAYDLMDVTGPYFSFIRTQDGGCLDQKFQLNDGTRRNAWILLAPTDIANGVGGSAIHGISIVPISASAPAGCGGSSTAAYDVWNPPVDVRYETGKVLKSIVSYHFAQSNLSANPNALERFYFTREYGFTRWEAWIPMSDCLSTFGASSPRCSPESAANFLKGRCSPDIIPARDQWGGQEWVRVDCRDSTRYVMITNPQIMANSEIGRTNGLIDIDSSFLNGVVVPPPVNGSCGSAHNQVVSASPSNNLCNVGAASSVSFANNTYLWSCSGTNGGASAQCSAPHQAPTAFVPQIYRGNHGLRHQIGYPGSNGQSWYVTVLQPVGQFLNFGPYVSEIPPGEYEVWFHLRVDFVHFGPTGLSLTNDHVLTLDVVSGLGSVVHAQRQVYRHDFVGDQIYTAIGLRFTLAGVGQQLEFRSQYRGSSFVELDRIELHRR